MINNIRSNQTYLGTATNDFPRKQMRESSCLTRRSHQLVMDESKHNYLGQQHDILGNYSITTMLTSTQEKKILLKKN